MRREPGTVFNWTAVCRQAMKNIHILINLAILLALFIYITLTRRA